MEDSVWSRLGAAARRPGVSTILVGAGLVAVGGFLYHLTRGTTLWFDDWAFVLNRRGSSLDTLLAPHGEHLSLVPVLLYKLLFATAGVGDYRPYRAMVIVAHLVLVALLFLYARRRVGDHLAMLAAALLALFGPGWEDILWPFQIGYLLSLIGGLGMLLALDHEAGWADAAACALLLLSLVSSGIGVPILLGVIVEFVLIRRAAGWWVVGAPLVLYAIWWIAYQHAPLHSENVYLTPGFVASGIASTFAALVGLGGNIVPAGQGTLLEWGPPLALAALALGIWRVTRWRALPARSAGLAMMLLSFWVIAGLGRASIQPAYSSRYLLVGAALTLMLVVELARGVTPGWAPRVVITVAAVAAVLSNVDGLRSGGAFLRSEAQVTRADLAVAPLARPFQPTSYLLHYMPGYPLVDVPLGSYLTVARTLGTPAFDVDELEHANEPAREQADLELITMERIGLVPIALHPSPHDCETLMPPGVAVPGTAPFEAALAVPSDGLLVGGSKSSVVIGLRRFGGQFQAIGSVAPGALALLHPPRDGAGVPWRAQIGAGAPTLACTL